MSDILDPSDAGRYAKAKKDKGVKKVREAFGDLVQATSDLGNAHQKDPDKAVAAINAVTDAVRKLDGKLGGVNGDEISKAIADAFGLAKNSDDTLAAGIGSGGFDNEANEALAVMRNAIANANNRAEAQAFVRLTKRIGSDQLPLGNDPNRLKIEEDAAQATSEANALKAKADAVIRLVPLVRKLQGGIHKVGLSKKDSVDDPQLIAELRAASLPAPQPSNPS